MHIDSCRGLLYAAGILVALHLSGCCCFGGGPAGRTSGAIEMTDKTSNRMGGGSTNSTLACHGTFATTPAPQALYDINLSYTARVTLIEVFVAPAGTTPVVAAQNKLLSATSLPNPPATWSANISGTFDGTSDTYGMVIQVTFQGGAMEEHTGRFRAILSHLGDPFPMD